MKKLSLLFLAAVLSIGAFAQEQQPTGNTKAQAIPYAWGEGIKVTANAGEGKWYKVDLYGKFNPTTGKSAEGNADANIIVANPLDEKATVDVTAYVGDNETSRHFTLQAGEFKTMNIGAGMLVRMGIQYVYMFIVMDVTITPAQAEKIEVVVEDAPSNSTPFIPVDFVWGENWATTYLAEGNNIPANKETWIKINDLTNKLPDGSTFKLFAQNLGSAATTIYGGLATDCPATNIQEQEKAVAANGIMSKELDPAMLDMMPDSIYIRLKANQPLKVWAQAVTPTLPDQPLFTITGATEVEKDHTYYLSDSILYKVDYATLTAPEYHVTKVEIKNNGGSAVELTGKVVKNAQPNGEIYSAIKRTTTLQPGQKLTKEIDNTLLGNLEAGDHVHALVTGGNSAVEFKLIEVCTEKDTCDVKDEDPMVISASEISRNQAANSTKWYKVNIAAAKPKADILMTMEANEAAELTVDIAADCKLGEPVQSYTGSGKTTTKTLSNSLFKGAGDIIYVRVHTDKAITVKAKMLTSIVWNGNEWEGGVAPDIDHAARIEGNLTIGTESTDDFAELKALGLTLKDENIKITIKNGGKLIVGAEGIKGSENIGQIIIEEGGILWIDPAATTNNKPFVTVKKNIELGLQTADGHTLDELHDLIALPIDNREAGVSTASIYYAHWDRMAGWIATDKFRNSFVGYNVYIPAAYATAPANVSVEFKGRLAANKNQTLNLPANGWYAFGNSWTAPIALSTIYSQLAGNDDAAVHFYVASPTDYSSEGLGTILDNYYIPATAEIASHLNITKINPMQGFFLHTNSSFSVELDYANLLAASASPAPKRVADNRNMVAAVLSNGTASDFVYMIEGEAGNAHKMIGSNLAIYAEDGLAQVANDNLIGTVLTVKTGDETEYTLSFTWLKGETLYIKDLENNNVIAMTAENQYTFTAEPNAVSERFQIIGRYDAPTGMENNAVIEGANKRIENGRVIIIKNGVKYDVLGSQL